MLLSSSQQLSRALKLKQKSMIELMMKASICHKSQLPEKNVKRWPYEKYSWSFWNFFLDPFTEKKFDENTKVITVEGNIAAGKKDFAQRLADQLGMYYVPDIELEKLYINPYGYDYRALNPLLPERMRHCDWAMFHENPSRHSVISLQHYCLVLRMFQYIKALQHMFNTGQGVVLNRSCFSERVFVEAMHNLGWLPQGYLRSDGARFYDFKNYHNYKRNLGLYKLLKPHLTIYLDTPVETCLERVRNDPDPMISESKAMVPEFLEEIEKAYEDIMLPKLEVHGHVVRYPYPERATDDDILDFIDDLSKLDFTNDPLDTTFDDWDVLDRRLWHFDQRYYFTNIGVMEVFSKMVVSHFDIAGIGDSISGVDMQLRNSLYEANLHPFGYYKNFYTDIRFNNILKVLLDYKPFHDRCYSVIQSHFRG